MEAAEAFAWKRLRLESNTRPRHFKRRGGHAHSWCDASPAPCSPQTYAFASAQLATPDPPQPKLRTAEGAAQRAGGARASVRCSNTPACREQSPACALMRALPFGVLSAPFDSPPYPDSRRLFFKSPSARRSASIA
eukprot:18796-Pleurochrysis_carterae.AAC.1